MSGIESGGYSIAKFGNVVLTRYFPRSDPRPSDDGVRAYALCPFFVPTRLMLEEYGREVSAEDAMRRAARDVYSYSKSRGAIQDIFLGPVSDPEPSQVIFGLLRHI